MEQLKEWKLEGIERLDECAEALTSHFSPGDLVLVQGEMGAGKTTLIRSMCIALNVVDKVSSPTYALVNTYRTASGNTVYHFDLYRIEHPEEALDIGIEEYLDDQQAIKLIEWPERIKEYLPTDAQMILVRVNPDGSRTISLRA